jgi:hypothetical protein
VRRLFYAIILLFINNAFFQVVGLSVLSLVQIIYLIETKPYEDSKVNMLETFNEVIVMICNYHLLVFVDRNVSTQLKYTAGWSLDLIFVMQFILNCYMYFKETILVFRMYARPYYLRIRAYTTQKLKKHALEEEKTFNEKGSCSIKEREPNKKEEVSNIDPVDDFLPYYLDNSEMFSVEE